MCRGRFKNGFGYILFCVYVVILDEVYFLYGSLRGEQVRWLFERLRRLKVQVFKEKWCDDERIQIVVMSVIMKDFEKILKYYIFNGEIVKVEGKREINLILDEIVLIDEIIYKYFCNVDF